MSDSVPAADATRRKQPRKDDMLGSKWAFRNVQQLPVLLARVLRFGCWIQPANNDAIGVFELFSSWELEPGGGYSVPRATGCGIMLGLETENCNRMLGRCRDVGRRAAMCPTLGDVTL